MLLTARVSLQPAARHPARAGLGKRWRGQRPPLGTGTRGFFCKTYVAP